MSQIKFARNKYEDKEIHKSLHPLLSAWFKYKFKVFSPPQKYTILNIHKGKNTLISAPTGSGKTLSAFTSVISELMQLNDAKMLEDKVYCVYISPLKALNNDIERNLNSPLEELQKAAKKIEKDIGIRVAVRTGDTTASQKSSQLKKPPHILITTPESLAIVLNAPKFREKFKDMKWCIIDEIHSLANNKRGVHLSVSMERLQKIAPQMTRIGLSATVYPLEEIARYLVGFEEDLKTERECTIVDTQFIKKFDLKVLSPVPDLINSSFEERNKAMYDLIDKLIQDHKSTLIFTNTRAATERVVHHLKEKFPRRYFSENIGAHHSSLSRDHRMMIERRLKEGELKCVVSSTSLELGIDIGYIDLVVLLGSPKSVNRALQRAGRAGHKLHEKVKSRLIVMDRDDLIECSILLKSSLEKKLDYIHIPKNCLDVIVQHIFGIAINEKIHIDDLFNLIRQSYCYNRLKREDFLDIIDYMSGKFNSLENRHVYAKIWYDTDTGIIGKRGKLARVLYMTNIGTIPDEAFVKVKIKDHTIGMIDETFLEKLSRGDIFVLGGRVYQFLFSRGMTAQVTAAEGKRPTVPNWVSEMLPLSFDLAMEINRFKGLIEEKFNVGQSKTEVMKFIKEYMPIDKNAREAIYSYLKQQYDYGFVSHDKRLLIEIFQDGARKNIVFHANYGRRVNDVLSRCLAYVIGRMYHTDIEVSLSDNGFVLSTTYPKINLDKVFTVLKASEINTISDLAISKTEVLKRRFRHCATRALMILRSYKGRSKTVGRQQLSSMLLLNAVREIGEHFPVLKEAKREVLEDVMDIKNAKQIVRDINNGKLDVKIIRSNLPTPFAFNLVAQGYSDVVKIDDKIEFIKRMHQSVEERIKHGLKVKTG